ncbi:Cnl2/NKP2 family protein [Gigaspora margarita]|uniref:Cnl2/NKP2 family protein n=1 Tax=Gigaspora margarita TaxID=4874 RepID=A0A8H4AY07_GIGMA|nr:Cnl2/NKP2 family protein [Gigaspora margarita]
MATEESVLLSYFLNSELESNITLKQFTNLFPNSYRNNKHLKTLYKEYQTGRNATREKVHQNTIEECKKFEMWKVRTCQDKDMMDIDMDQDEMLDESNDRLILNQAIEILSIAEKQMTDEINTIELECNELFQDIQRINEDMSDLRYGRIGPKGFNEADVIEELKKMMSSCNTLLASSAL